MIAAISLLALAVGPKLSAWIVFDDQGSSVASFQAHARELFSVSAQWLVCDKSGVIHRPAKPTGEQRTKVIDIAKKNRVKLFGLVANAGFTPEGVEAAMATEDSRARHIQAMVDVALQDRLAGIDLDYESLKAADRVPFSRFVTQLGKALHAKHLELVLAVHAKESEPGNWDGAEAQDFAVLGKAADFIRVMTYDFHWETSEAGPIAPPDWVQRVMTFAKTVIPPSKLDLGIPAYGYSWLNKKADSFDWNGWNCLVKQHGMASRDPQSRELKLSYDGRTAFFSDGEASRSKIEMAQSLGLHGLAMWRLGSEDPEFWTIYKQLSK